MAAPSPFEIVGLIGDIKELTKWLIKKVESFKESATIYEKLQNVKNYHEACINLQLDQLEERGRTGIPADEQQQRVQRQLIEDLHNAFDAATDFLYRHWPRDAPARILWSLTGEAGANNVLSEVEKAQSRLSVYLNLRLLRDGSASNIRDPQGFAQEFAIQSVPEGFPVTGGKIRVGKAEHRPRTAPKLDTIWFLEEKIRISDNGPVATPRSLELLAGPESLAFKTYASERSAGILPFIGYTAHRRKGTEWETIFFKLPDNVLQREETVPQPDKKDGAPKKVPQLQTLQIFIRKNEYESLSLDHRLRLARQLSEALGKIHAAGLTHRNVRSENVVVLKEVVPPDHGKPKDTETKESSPPPSASLDEAPPKSTAQRVQAPKERPRSQSLSSVVNSLRRRSSERAKKPKEQGKPKKADKTQRPPSRKSSFSGMNLLKKSSSQQADDPGGHGQPAQQEDQGVAVSWPRNGYYIGAGHPSLFIMGWDCVARQDLPMTPLALLPGDVGRNFYQHPHVQNGEAVNRWNIGYDIYSLGVCLLEIGLWKTLTKPESASETPKMVASTFLRDEVVAKWGEGHKAREKSGAEMKELLEEIARRSLGGRMGHPHATFVVSCLTWLDGRQVAAGDIIHEHLEFKERKDNLFSQINLGGGGI